MKRLAAPDNLEDEAGYKRISIKRLRAAKGEVRPSHSTSCQAVGNAATPHRQYPSEICRNRPSTTGRRFDRCGDRLYQCNRPSMSTSPDSSMLNLDSIHWSSQPCQKGQPKPQNSHSAGIAARRPQAAPSARGKGVLARTQGRKPLLESTSAPFVAHHIGRSREPLGTPSIALEARLCHNQLFSTLQTPVSQQIDFLLASHFALQHQYLNPEPVFGGKNSPSRLRTWTQVTPAFEPRFCHNFSGQVSPRYPPLRGLVCL